MELGNGGGFGSSSPSFWVVATVVMVVMFSGVGDELKAIVVADVVSDVIPVLLISSVRVASVDLENIAPITKHKLAMNVNTTMTMNPHNSARLGTSMNQSCTKEGIGALLRLT